MDIQLGQFEGDEVQLAELRVVGATAERVGKFRRGEEVVIVAKVRIDRVAHLEKQVDKTNLYVRQHRAGVVRLYPVPTEAGEKLLDEARREADAAFGVQGLFDPPEAVLAEVKASEPGADGEGYYDADEDPEGGGDE